MENSWRCSYKLLEMVAEQGVEFHSNILNFCRSYSEFRPVHGDGGCFYRSFIFSYLEQVPVGRIHMRTTVFLLLLKGWLGNMHTLGGLLNFPRATRLGWASEFSRSLKIWTK